MNALLKEINATNVQPGSLAVWWLGQEGYAVKTSELVMYIDPYLSTYAERITAGGANEHVRMTPPPMPPGEVTNADLVLCTHDHADHIDPDGIPVIAQASPGAKFVVPECARRTLLAMNIEEDRIHTLCGDDSLELLGVNVAALPAKHEQFDHDEQHGYPYLSYVIQVEGLTLLHAGDTIPYDGQVERVKPFGVDIAFLPINGRDEERHRLEFEGNFTCDEAVDFALAIGAKLTVPMHYDMFTLNTADVNDFRRLAAERGLRYRVLETARNVTLNEERLR